MQPPFLSSNYSGNYQDLLLKTTEAHLSNGTCDLKLNGKQEKNHFLAQVFMAFQVV